MRSIVCHFKGTGHGDENVNAGNRQPTQHTQPQEMREYSKYHADWIEVDKESRCGVEGIGQKKRGGQSYIYLRR